MPMLWDWCQMGLIKTDRLCHRCGIHHLKDYSISGDYNKDGRLQSFCPSCGVMHPPISANTFEVSISNKRRHNIGTMIAKIYELPYKEIHEITSKLKTVEDCDFVDIFISFVVRDFGINPSREEIENYLEGSGKNNKR